MGCLHSKKEPSDLLHPNSFRVVNIDEHGDSLCEGQLEIKDSNIVLYREGRESTVWPLHSLRRYGFEEEVFSFESGRRCETGEGIYAFKCRKAALLFRALQNQIQLRNVTHDSGLYPVSHMNPSPQVRQTLQANVVHRSSIDNGQLDNLRAATNGNILASGSTERNANQTLRSPSSADILEVMPLYPQSQSSTNHTSNVYQLRDFKREHNNNNQGDPRADSAHVYTNDFNRDLARLRKSLREGASMFEVKDKEDEPTFLENRYYANTNIANNPAKICLSPTLSLTSEHYAQLNLEQQESRYYINIKHTDKNLQEMKHNEMVSTPPTPGGKQVEYCNLSLGAKQEVNTYANLSLGELGDSFKSGKQVLSFSTDHNLKYSDTGTFTPMSPVEELEVNYAVLDIDSNKEAMKMPRDVVSPPSQTYSSPKSESIASCSSQKRGYLVSQSSVDNTTTLNDNAPTAKSGYTTIDFDKTVALTSVAAEADVDCDGPRKMRHNSCIIACGSPNNGEKYKNN